MLNRLLFASLVIALACLTDDQVKSRICWALCRQDGYDTGHYKKPKCFCSNEKDFSKYTETVLKIPKAFTSDPD